MVTTGETVVAHLASGSNGGRNQYAILCNILSNLAQLLWAV